MHSPYMQYQQLLVSYQLFTRKAQQEIVRACHTCITYICIYIYIYVCMYVCRCISMNTCTFVCLCIYIYIYIYITYTCVCVCVCVCLCKRDKERARKGEEGGERIWIIICSYMHVKCYQQPTSLSFVVFQGSWSMLAK